MADTKKSQLPVAGALDGTEIIDLVQNGANVQATVQDVANHVAGLIPAGADGADGVNGVDGASIVSADFVADDLVFTKDDATEITIVGAKTALTGAPGAPGADGNAGASAYDTAVANGFVGDEATWLATLAGQVGPAGPAGADGADGASIVSAAFVSDDLVFTRDDSVDVTIVGAKTALTGPAGSSGSNGTDGADGASAYEVAVANGFVGTEAAWLLSLKGDTGATGVAGADGVDGDMTNPMTAAGDIIYGGTSGTPTRLARGTDGQVLTLSSGNPSWMDTSGGGGSSLFVSEIVVTGSPVASIEFTGLDGNTDGDYYIVGRLNVSSTSTVSLYSYINGDTTNSNYRSQVTQSNETNFYASAEPTARIGLFSQWSGVYSTLIAEYINAGGLITTYSKCNHQGGVLLNNISVIQHSTIGFTNITGIKLQISSGDISVGSSFQLYKRL